VQARRWCFPVTGCIPYRGYFDAAGAQEKAAELAAQGFDVHVAGARAYSTLGWFDDPILSTMLYRDPVLRVEILFHEMAHQKLYVPGDGSFNEAFATFVAQLGTERWLREQAPTWIGCPSSPPCSTRARGGWIVSTRRRNAWRSDGSRGRVAGVRERRACLSKASNFPVGVVPSPCWAVSL